MKNKIVAAAILLAASFCANVLAQTAGPLSCTVSNSTTFPGGLVVATAKDGDTPQVGYGYFFTAKGAKKVTTISNSAVYVEFDVVGSYVISVATAGEVEKVDCGVITVISSESLSISSPLRRLGQPQLTQLEVEERLGVTIPTTAEQLALLPRTTGMPKRGQQFTIPDGPAVLIGLLPTDLRAELRMFPQTAGILTLFKEVATSDGPRLQFVGGWQAEAGREIPVSITENVQSIRWLAALAGTVAEHVAGPNRLGGNLTVRSWRPDWSPERGLLTGAGAFPASGYWLDGKAIQLNMAQFVPASEGDTWLLGVEPDSHGLFIGGVAKSGAPSGWYAFSSLWLQ